MRTDGWERTDGHNEAKSRFSRFCERSWQKGKLDFLRKQTMSILRNEIIFKFSYLSYNVHVYVIRLQSRLLGWILFSMWPSIIEGLSVVTNNTWHSFWSDRRNPDTMSASFVLSTQQVPILDTFIPSSHLSFHLNLIHTQHGDGMLIRNVGINLWPCPLSKPSRLSFVLTNVCHHSRGGLSITSAGLPPSRKLRTN